MSTLIINIGCLVGLSDPCTKFLRGKEMNHIETLSDAWILIEDGKFSAFGSMNDIHCTSVAQSHLGTGDIFDAKGGWLFPSFCDSHTHIVYAGSREREFEDKINGLSYEEIAKRGGGILNSAKRLRETSENELFDEAIRRIEEVIKKGTGAIEIKSGYGLSLESELKMLRVIRRIKDTSPLTVKATFLGAHSIPEEFRGNKEGYVNLICNEMLPAIATEELADFVDVFCDKGFFSVADTARILDKAAEFGLKGKIHADELALSGGTDIAVRKEAVSVDHLERITENEIQLLSCGSTIPTALPGASFFLGMPYAPARKMIDSGLGVALASDYNPGSSPSGDMKFITSLGCIKMRLTPEEALNATTINGAYAMESGNETGSIAIGKKANFFITEKLPSLAFLPYAYSSPIIKHIFLEGQQVA